MMREEIIACFGVFVVMALSNAIVPYSPFASARLRRAIILHISLVHF